MVSIPRPSLAGQIGGSPTESTSEDSPGSPKSWADSLLELDSDLQKICGPTRSISLSSSTPHRARTVNLSNSYPLSSGLLSPPIRNSVPSAMAFGRRTHSQETSRPHSACDRSPSPRSHFRPEYLRSHSCNPINTAAISGRPLIVRQEQSPGKLAEKLSRICGPGQSGTLPEFDFSTLVKPQLSREVMTLTSTAVRRESLSSAFRCDFEMGDLSVVDLAVCMANENSLHIMHVTTNGASILREVGKPSAAEIHRLMCYVVDRKLIIRERSKSLWSCDPAEIGPPYLPIIKQNELTHELTVVLHIPRELRYEDISVRVIDDHLIISRKRASFTESIEPDIRTRFELGLTLPDMGHSRGVDASLTHNNQLLIVVTFD